MKEWRAKAEGGDGDAMYLLGAWYEYGEKGLAIDDAQARAWYERCAAARNPIGIACFGQCLLLGLGGPQDDVFGVMNVTEAAGLGSEGGAYRLGEAFYKGGFGLPKDPARARYWLKKVVDGECKIQHVDDAAKTYAAKLLEELPVDAVE